MELIKFPHLGLYLKNLCLNIIYCTILTNLFIFEFLKINKKIKFFFELEKSTKLRIK